MVRLDLVGIAHGQGSSLQEAADDLINRLLSIVHALRSSGFQVSSELRPDVATLDFLFELGEMAAGGRDIRARVFG